MHNIAEKVQKFPQVATLSRPKSSKNHNESTKNNGLGQDFKAKFQRCQVTLDGLTSY